MDFFVDFFGPFSWGKQARKNPPKNPPKNPRFSRQLFDQNPLREISALRETQTSRKRHPQKRRPQSCPYRRCGVDIEFPYGLRFRREFCWVLQVRVAFGFDTEFPYQVRIVDRGLIATTLFAAAFSDSQKTELWRGITGKICTILAEIITK